MSKGLELTGNGPPKPGSTLTPGFTVMSDPYTPSYTFDISEMILRFLIDGGQIVVIKKSKTISES